MDAAAGQRPRRLVPLRSPASPAVKSVSLSFPAAGGYPLRWRPAGQNYRLAFAMVAVHVIRGRRRPLSHTKARRTPRRYEGV